MAATDISAMDYAKQFHVFRLEEENKLALCREQPGYYAISLIAGNTSGAEAMLCFYNPQDTHTGKPLPRKLAGFACFFNTAILSSKMREIVRSLPMFKKGTSPVYYLNPSQDNHIRGLFEKMLAEANNNYAFKYELMGNYLATIIHQALKIQPSK